MASTVEELVEAGLTEAEAQRVINRRAKAEKKSAGAKERAERMLPKLQEQLDYETSRSEQWAEKAAATQAKIDKYVAIVSGESDEEPDADDEADAA